MYTRHFGTGINVTDREIDGPFHDLPDLNGSAFAIIEEPVG